MNKRTKKKRELVAQVQGTKKAVDIALGLIKALIDENLARKDEIAELQSLVERNAQATNAEMNSLRDLIDDQSREIASLRKEVKQIKKPFWKR